MRLRHLGKSELSKWAVILTVGVAIGLITGYLLWRPSWKNQKEVSAPEIRQEDRSLVLKKVPSSNPQPKQTIPKGSVVERVVSVVVRPSQEDADATQPRDVVVDMTIVKDTTGHRRVIASSSSGVVISGLDVPIENTQVTVQEKKHAIGIRYQLSTLGSYGYGPAYTYDKGRFRIGVDGVYAKHFQVQRSEWIAGVSIMVRF